MPRLMQAFGVLLGIIAMAAGPASAQDSPSSRPLRLVVSFPPGGGVDAVARLFADKMSALLGQTVIVENRGGASGIIAGKQVASAEPDGTSVLIASNSMVVAQVMSPMSASTLPAISRHWRALRHKPSSSRRSPACLPTRCRS